MMEELLAGDDGAVSRSAAADGAPAAPAPAAAGVTLPLRLRLRLRLRFGLAEILVEVAIDRVLDRGLQHRQQESELAVEAHLGLADVQASPDTPGRSNSMSVAVPRAFEVEALARGRRRSFARLPSPWRARGGAFSRSRSWPWVHSSVGGKYSEAASFRTRMRAGPRRRKPAESRGDFAMPNIADLFAQHLTQPRHGAVPPLPRRGVARRDRRASSPTEIARWQAAFRREGLVAGDRIVVCARNGADVGRGRPGGARAGARRGAALRRRQSRQRRVVRGATPRRGCWSSRTSRLARGSAQGRRRRERAAADGRAACRRSADADDGAVTVDEFLPAGGGGDVEVSDAARRDARDDLLHVGHVGPAEGRDAVARQHPRQRRGMPRRRGMARPTTGSCRSCRCRTCSSAPAATTCRCRSARRSRMRAASRRSPTTSRRRRRRSCSRCRGSSSGSPRASTRRSRSRAFKRRSSTRASRAAIASRPARGRSLDRCS